MKSFSSSVVLRARRRRLVAGSLGVLALAAAVIGFLTMQRDEVEVPLSDRLLEVRRRVLPRLRQEVESAGLTLGAPVLIRSFKESREFEVWLESTQGGALTLFRTYRIANWGPGTLGPKLKEGDYQSPEGFYVVGPAQLNPNSDHHLSLNTGYPNAHDQSLGRTGSFIMVHGGSGSIGCIALTDEKIEEVYLLVEAALGKGQPAIPIHLLPFRLTPQRLAEASTHPCHDFWQNLREGYDSFETTHRPPSIRTEAGRYIFE